MYLVRPKSSPKSHKFLRATAVSVTALLGALIFIYFLGPASYEIHGLAIKVSTIPSWYGKTIIQLPPFGSIIAATHNLPFELHLELDYIGTELSNTINSITNNNHLISNLKSSLNQYIINYFMRLLLVGAAGAFCLVFLIWRTKFINLVLATLSTTLLIAICLFAGILDYDINAFKEPEYTGVIAMAPQLIPEPQTLLDQWEKIQHQTHQLVTNIQTLFKNIDSGSLLTDPDSNKALTRILLVSDLHSNPIGITFIKGLAENFDVDLIIDAGDLTDFGSPLEARITEELQDLKAPYVFCPGNHDNPDIINFVEGLDNIYVLGEEPVQIQGLTIMGNPDPLSNTYEVEIKDQEQWDIVKEKKTEEIKSQAQKYQKPDIFVTHNHQIAHNLTDIFPVIVYGHTHSLEIMQNKSTLFFNPGTAGAAGARGLYANSGTPYSAIILYLKPGELPVAADTIKYEPYAIYCKMIIL